jgi:hypothetical protein
MPPPCWWGLVSDVPSVFGADERTTSEGRPRFWEQAIKNLAVYNEDPERPRAQNRGKRKTGRVAPAAPPVERTGKMNGKTFPAPPNHAPRRSLSNSHARASLGCTGGVDVWS